MRRYFDIRHFSESEDEDGIVRNEFLMMSWTGRCAGSGFDPVADERVWMEDGLVGVVDEKEVKDRRWFW